MARIGRYLAYAIAALAVLAAGAAFILPRLLDTPRVRADIQNRLSLALNGEVRWDSFRLRLLPAPNGMLRMLRVQMPAGSVSADEVAVALRFWPLLFGRPEITSVTVTHPVVRIAGPRRAREEKPPPEGPRTRALEAYRAVMRPLVDGLQSFAPDTRVALEGAELSLRAEGVPPIELSAVNMHATTGTKGVELDATAASPYWASLKLAGRVVYADLSSTIELDLKEIKAQAWLDWLLASGPVAVGLPSADLSAQFRGDAAKALELEVDARAASVDIARKGRRLAIPAIELKGKVRSDENEVSLELPGASLGASGISGALLRYGAKDRSLEAHAGYTLDLAQLLDYLRQLAPPATAEKLAKVRSASGALQGKIQLAGVPGQRRFVVTIEKSDAALDVTGVPGPLRVDKAVFDIDARTAKIEQAALSIPAGRLFLSTLRYSTADGSAAAKGDFDLDLGRSFEVVRGLLPENKREALAIVESLQGRASGSADVSLSKKQWRVALEIAKSDSALQLRGLPAPVRLAGASVVATPAAVSIDRARLSLLDTSAVATAKIGDFAKGPRVQGSLPEALVGAKLLDWIWQAAKIPAGFAPRAPIRLAVPQLALDGKRSLDVQANARFERGAALAVDLGWSPAGIDVRRLTIKDAMSDASIGLRTRGKVLEGRYAGKLDTRTVAAMLKSGAAPGGAVSGDFRFVFDREEPRRTTAQGTLEGAALDLTWLAGQPAKIEKIALAADGDTVRIAEANVEYAGQRASLRGVLKRGAEAPVVDAQIDSPGVLVDALLPKKPKAAAPKPAPPRPAPAKPEAAGEKAPKEEPDLWPLPVTGRIALKAGFLQYAHFKAEPVAAVLTMERERAQLQLSEGQVCGLALPFTLEATPKGYVAAAKISAKKLPFEQTAKCLSADKVLLTGTLDLDAELSSEGKLADLAKNLKGSVNADLRDGLVMKFPLIGNILSMKNIVALAEQGGPKLGAEGFPYRQLSAKGNFDGGYFLLKEGVFYSNAVGLGADGWVSLTDYQSRLTVLVAPLALLNEAVRKLPILGYVVGGTFTSLPVAVSGDIRDPLVVPLGPGAITSELTGIITRTLSLPGQLAPSTPPPRR